MDDLISRQAAIDGVKTLHDVAWKNWHEPTLSANVVLDMIRELPSAQPERKKGKWKKLSGRWFHNDVQCSECGNTLDMNGVNAGRGDANFCPNCGAQMIQEGENNDE